MTRLRTTKPNSSGSLNQCKSTHKTQPPPNTTTDMYGSNNSPPTFLNPDEAYNCATTTLELLPPRKKGATTFWQASVSAFCIHKQIFFPKSKRGWKEDSRACPTHLKNSITTVVVINW